MAIILGFLNTLGVVDIAGAGAVHICGAMSALVATLLLKPRLGRYDNQNTNNNNSNNKKSGTRMGNATNVLVGMFMLW